MLFCFTATGNSLYVAKQLEKDPVSIPQEMRKADRHYKADSIGIVCPLFEFEIPRLVKDFIRESSFEPRHHVRLPSRRRGRAHAGLAGIRRQEGGLCEHDHHARQRADRV